MNRASGVAPVHPEYATLLAACTQLNGAENAQVSELLALHGVASEYIEYSGNMAHIPFADRVDILQLKGVSLFSDARLDQEKLAFHIRLLTEGPWLSLLPPVAVLTPGGRENVVLHICEADLVRHWQWRIVSEAGEEFVQDFVPADLPESAHAMVGGNRYSGRQLTLSPFSDGELPHGYHHLFLRCLDPERDASEPAQTNMALIVAPSRSFEPRWALAGKRLWGFSVQLYSLRSSRNWGIGDFTDLQVLIRLAAGQGAQFLVLNPLHALDLRNPDHCSPYSPNDRRRLNVLYIDPTVEADFCENAALRTLTESPQWQQQLKKMQQREAIDYRAVAEFKVAVLISMFRHFMHHHWETGSDRAVSYERFVAEHGDSLQGYAVHEASRYHSGSRAGERSDSEEAGGVQSDPRFTLYTQWLAEKQLEDSQQLARELGMRIGLIRDLAVGGDGNGAEVSLNKGLFCEQASIGAPPDPLAPQGQNWGLPPLDPLQLQHSAYRHFIDLLRTNMAHCGALRIDHVMALMRLWWCPRFPGRGGGAYVHYPVDDLFALLRLESVRNQCVVIGEDLGVVPPEVREYLNASAIFSNALFYFEKYDDFHFKRPEHYKPKSLAMVANHDVPTLAAWWNCADLRLRHQLGLIASEQELEEQTHWRGLEKLQVLRWLGEQLLLPARWQGHCEMRSFDASLCAAIIRCCARGSAQLLSVQLEDLALLETPVNIPGTSTEYPNWRRKLPIDLQELLSSETGKSLLSGFAAERGQAGD